MAPSREDYLEAAWATGVLDWKLRPHQRPLYDSINDSATLLQVVRCARRFGKTFTTLLWVTEQAIRRPQLICRYAAPTEKSLRKYILPNMRELLKDCPKHHRPKFDTQDSVWRFPNESELHLAGTDKEHVEKLRGPRTDIGVCDEAGSMDKLRYIVNDVLLPSTLDAVPEGRMLIISTPPPTPDHDFTAMSAEAKAEGRLIQYTVNENTWLQRRPGLLARYAAMVGGVESSTWRREYLCEDVVDESLAIVPEFTEEAEKRIAVAQPRPAHWQAFEAMDPGFSPSKTGVLFGYYDFLAGKLVVEDELELERMRTDELATKLKAKEAELGYQDVPHRWSDIEPLLLNDLGAMHGMRFQATNKDLLEVMVNKLRIWVQQDRLRINPRCGSLLAQLRVGIFNERRTEFEWSSRFGHYDLLAALVYMVRNCPEHVNPYPRIPDGVASPTHFIPLDYFKPQGNEAMLSELFRFKMPRKVIR